MRTTIDLPPDLHQQALAIARDTSRSLSETVADLMRRALGQDGSHDSRVRRDEETGLPVFSTGRVITTEDVRSLEDDVE